MELTWDHAIDGIVILLLAITIATAWRLHRRLRDIRRAQASFQDMIDDFNNATTAADRAVMGLKTAVADKGEQLSTKVAQGQSLFDELSFMVDAGNNLADRLERLAAQARQAVAESQAEREAQMQARAEAEAAEDHSSLAESALRAARAEVGAQGARPPQQSLNIPEDMRPTADVTPLDSARQRRAAETQPRQTRVAQPQPQPRQRPQPQAGSQAADEPGDNKRPSRAEAELMAALAARRRAEGGQG